MTKAQKARNYMAKNPNATAKQVAAATGAALSAIYKIRKEAEQARNRKLEEILKMPPMPEAPVQNRKITLNWAQAAIAKKMGMSLEDYTKKGLESGTLQYDDERPASVDTDEEEGDTVDVILNNRAKQYGKFRDGAQLMQEIKRTLSAHANKHGRTFTDSQWEALEMIVHKIARIVNGDPQHVDSWRDIAGYAQLVADELEGNVR